MYRPRLPFKFRGTSATSVLYLKGTSTKDVLVHIAIFHLRTSPFFLRVQVKVLVRNLMRTSTCTPSRVLIYKWNF
jgi:hypothetical protein